jgi:hypothetical protein
MRPSRRFHRARSNRPRDRIADAWAVCTIWMKAPSPTGQIQTMRTTLDALAGVPSDAGPSERLNGTSFQPAQLIKRP